jgi:hypothetical protein|tara:strand:+ start:196 stop:588 length:393 start_codon:yes stop_codon:yes gene_type:complete
MVPPRKNKSIGHNKPPSSIPDPSSYDGVTFTKGPMHINHFYEISKCGVNALRLYQYIRTIQGLKYPGTTETSHLPVKVDNKKLYEWFGVGPNKKWEAICKLEKKKIIKVRRGGRGRLPTVEIVLPKKKLN